MHFPPEKSEIDANKMRIEMEKLRTFDVVLPEVILHRILIDEGITNREVYGRLKKDIANALREHINPMVLEVILSGDEMSGHHFLDTPKAWQLVAMNDDNISSSIRKLIKFAYDDIPHDVVRKKIVGCINVVIFNLNNPDFIIEAIEPDNKQYVKSIELRKRITASEYLISKFKKRKIKKPE